MKRLALLFLTFTTLLHAEPSYAVTEGVNAAWVAGAVNAITGDHYVAETDYQIQSAAPLTLPRVYVSSRGTRTFVGWQLFQHLYAAYYMDQRNDTVDHRIELLEPNGTVLNFEKYKTRSKIKTVFFNPIETAKAKGLTNAGRGKISGQTNLKNVRVELQENEKQFIFYGSDGTVRCYRKIKEPPETLAKDHFYATAHAWYQLAWEKLPNQTKIFYNYDNHRRLSSIRTTNLSESKTYSSAQLKYHSHKTSNQNFDIETNDGRVLNYRFAEHHGIHRLTQVSTPAFPGEALHHGQHIKDLGSTIGYLLTERWLPNQRNYKLEYYTPGKNPINGTTIKLQDRDPRLYRVKTLSAPVGSDPTPHVTHKFFYHPDKHLTEVRDIENLLTRYEYSPDLRLLSKNRYGHGDALYSSQRFVWAENGPNATQLLCHTFYAGNVPVLSKRYFYDDHGNVIEERTYGQITGKSAPLSIGADGFPLENGVETYTIRRAYSQDSYHLLLKEEEPNGKVTLNTYLPNTSLLISQLICEGPYIKLRKFYDYTADYILALEIIDDGSALERDNLQGVKTRKVKRISLISPGHPYQDMPYVIEEKYWNGSQEVLLKKTVLLYTAGGLVERQDVYDASNTHCYSLNFKYNGTGRLVEETNALNQTAKYDYDGVGNKTFFQDFSGKTTTHFTYDFSNRLTQVEETGSDGLKRITRHSYDLKHNRIASIDPFGHETRYHYDAFGRPIEVHLPPIPTPQGSLITPITMHSYDSLDREVMTKAPSGDTTHKRYNIHNQVTFIEHPDHTTEEFIYALDGTLQTHINQKGFKTSYTHDIFGHITSQTDALGQVTTYTYDSFNLIALTDPEGNTTHYEYDGAGRKIAEQLNRERTEYSYDSLGRLHTVKQGDLLTITEYNYLDQVTEERKENTNGDLLTKVHYSYDQAGNLAHIERSIDGQKSVETFRYDSFNRLIESQNALGHTTTTHYNDHFQNSYNQTVLQKTETDPLGLQIITTYDTQGHVAVIEKKNPQTLTTEENFYDVSGNLTCNIKNHLSKTQWDYGPMNRLKTLIEGGTKITEFTYTETGFIHTQKKPDQTLLTYRYDPLDQKIEEVSSDGSIHYHYSYNKIGQLIGVLDKVHQTSSWHQYDPLGHLLSEKLANGLLITFSYDDRGRKETVQLPDQTFISYQYDALHLRTITHGNHHHHFTSYDLSGNLLQEQRVGHLGSLTYTYDLIGHKTSSQTPLQQAQYDPVGNVTHLTYDKNTQTFEYDSLYHLTAEKNHRYTYDPHGNRISKDHQSYQFNSLHQLSDLRYDPNGNPLQDQHTTYTYDARDRLISSQTPESFTKFYYDHKGRLLKQTIPTDTHLFLYDENKEIGMTDSSGRLLQLRILNPLSSSERGSAVLLEIQGQEYYPHHDLFGNIKALYDLDGHLIESYDYSAFGEGLAPSLNPWQYASKRTFSDLINFGHRFYIPKYGRWLTPDPAGFADNNTHLYLFVENNPFSKLDLYGLNFLDFNQHYLHQEDPSQPSELSTHTPYEATRIVAVPVIEAVGNIVIDTANFCADVGFALSVPQRTYINDPECAALFSERANYQNDFDSLRTQWKSSIQSCNPTKEIGAVYHNVRLTAESAIGAYSIVRGFGLAIQKTVNSFLNVIKTSNVNIDKTGGIGLIKTYLPWSRKNSPKVDKIVDLEKRISEWLGEGTKLIKNKAGDPVFFSKDGLRCVRFDFNKTNPHNNPHAHIEIKVDDKWVKSGQIYPVDVPHN